MMQLLNHEVEPHPDYNDYYITRCGKVISTKRREPKVLKAWHNKRGYRRVKLSENGETSNFRVAMLVLEAWQGKAENCLDTVDHINSIRDDDRIENLRWLNHRDNIRRQFDR